MLWSVVAVIVAFVIGLLVAKYLASSSTRASLGLNQLATPPQQLQTPAQHQPSTEGGLISNSTPPTGTQATEKQNTDTIPIIVTAPKSPNLDNTQTDNEKKNETTKELGITTETEKKKKKKNTEPSNEKNSTPTKKKDHSPKTTEQPIQHEGRRILKNKSTPKYRFDISDLVELDVLRQVFSDQITGVPVKNRHSKLKTHKNCFIGAEAVDWLLANVSGIDRRKATELGIRLWSYGLFVGVPNRARPFSDDEYLFRFVRAVRYKVASNQQLLRPNVLSARGSGIQGFSPGDANRANSEGQLPLHQKKKKKKKLSSFGFRKRRTSAADAFFGVDEGLNVPLTSRLTRIESWMDVQELSGWVTRWVVIAPVVPSDSKSRPSSITLLSTSTTSTTCTSTSRSSSKEKLKELKKKEKKKKKKKDKLKPKDQDRQQQQQDIESNTDTSDDALKSEEDKPVQVQKWQVEVYAGIADADLQHLLVEMHAKGTGLSIRSRRSRVNKLKMHRHCFVGKRAIDWLLINNKATTRDEAIQLMDSLMLRGLVLHSGSVRMHSGIQFRDDKSYFKFRNLEESGALQADPDTNAAPMASIQLKESLTVKLHKEKKYVLLVLYSPEGNAIFGSGTTLSMPLLDSPQPLSARAQKGLSVGAGIRLHTHRRTMSACTNTSEFSVENKSTFVMRVHKKHDMLLKRTIFALEAAILLSVDSSYITEPISLPSEYYSQGSDSPLTSHNLSVDDSGGDSDDDSEQESAKDTCSPDLTTHNAGSVVDARAAEEIAQMRDVPHNVLTDAERVVLSELRKRISSELSKGNFQFLKPSPSSTNHDEIVLQDDDLLRYLRCRKLNADDALQLIGLSVPFRQANNLHHTTIADAGYALTGSAKNNYSDAMIRWDPACVDNLGRPILYIFTQYYRPKLTPPLDLVRAVMYVMDLAAYKNDDVQRNGFSIVVDCKDSSYSNFDRKMPRILLDAIVSKYPARVGYVVITNVPWFFKFVWGLLRPMLSEQLAQKFHIVGVEQLVNFVSGTDVLMREVGGSSSYNHADWVKARAKAERVVV